MKIKCKETTSQKFDLQEVTTIFTNDHDYHVGGHGLELGQEYLVMGMVIYQDTNCLYYLIDINKRPDWFPYLLFDVIDNSFPPNWFIKVYRKNMDSDVYILSGFDELCNNEDFYNLLIEREDESMLIYFKRKMELEKYYEDLKYLK